MAVPDLQGIAKLSEMQEIASSRGGKCLSASYVNVRTHLAWECSEGHQWRATPDQVKGGINKVGNWCPKCSRVRARQKQLGSLNELIDLAASKGGKCLSTEYKGVNVHHLWECAAGHKWEAVPLSIKGRPSKNGSWCPECSGNKRLTIEAMEEIARCRGGKCLSGNYLNTYTKLCWECSEGHIWTAPPARILRGGWCPKCNFSTGEKICRIYFETLFGKKFPPAHKTELEWLVSTNGVTSMELDGYCEDLGLAFEHHGKHHYQDLRYNSSNTSVLKDIQQRDERKRTLCNSHGITLIEVPEIGSLTRLDDLESTIRKLCQEASVVVPQRKSNATIDISSAFISDNKDRLRAIQSVAASKGGQCLSTEYISSTTKMRWRCSEGHEWETTPSNLMPRKNDSGTWCPICSAQNRGIAQRGLPRNHAKREDLGKEHESVMSSLHKIAADKGGRLISDEYVKDNVKLRWECSKGHMWMASPGQIKGSKSRSGTWCPVCAGAKRGESQRLNISMMRILAEERGGRCLSEEYINAKTPLLWECAKGHQWEAIADIVKNRGSWCPKCARS